MAEIETYITFFNYHYTKPEEFPKVEFTVGVLDAEEFNFEDDVIYEIQWPDVQKD